MNVIYTNLKTLVCNIVFDVAVYTYYINFTIRILGYFDFFGGPFSFELDTFDCAYNS